MIGSSRFRVAFGNILSSSAQVLVSSDDNYLTMSGGVSASIGNAAGDALQLHARKLIPLVQGDVAVTTAGLLSAQYVFHAVTIDRNPWRYPDAGCIKTLSGRCIELAEVLGIKSIAFPPLGTGSGKFPMEKGADTMVREIADRLGRGSSIESVELLLWARPGVAVTDLHEFYQRAASLASLSGQGRRLLVAMEALEDSLAEAGNKELQLEARTLLSRIRKAGDVLNEHPADIEAIENLETASNIERTGKEVLRVADRAQDTVLSDDGAVEIRAVQTRLEGLSMLLNVHYGALNKLQIEKARYGGLGVPLILDNQIDAVNQDVIAVEAALRGTRARLAELLAEPLSASS